LCSTYWSSKPARNHFSDSSLISTFKKQNWYGKNMMNNPD
jgi:hypothetical protein